METVEHNSADRNYDAMTTRQLKGLVKDRGLSGGEALWNARKPALVALLKGDIKSLDETPKRARKRQTRTAARPVKRATPRRLTGRSVGVTVNIPRSGDCRISASLIETSDGPAISLLFTEGGK